VTVQERREELLAWMHDQPATSIRGIFLATPLALYSCIGTLQRDVYALRDEGRLQRKSTRGRTVRVLWEVA
jgi:hypothetical protein